MGSALSFPEQVRQLIRTDDLPEALRFLQELLKNSPKLNEVLLQSARLSDIGRQIRLGLVDFNQANLTKNQIRVGLLELLAEIETQDYTLPEVRGELERFTTGKTIIQYAEKIYNIEKIDKADFS